MKKFALFTSALLLCAITMNASAYKGEKLAKHAKIQIEEARVIALKAYPGTITEEALKRGKSGLHYSFTVKEDGTTQMVGVDAKTGKILKYKVKEYKGK